MSTESIDPAPLEKQCCSPSETHQTVLPTHDLCSHVRITAGCQSPSPRSESLVQNPSVLDLWEVEQTVWETKKSGTTRSGTVIIRQSTRTQVRIDSPGLISTSSGTISANSVFEISEGNGSVERPWKDLDQSCRPLPPVPVPVPAPEPSP